MKQKNSSGERRVDRKSAHSHSQRLKSGAPFTDDQARRLVRRADTLSLGREHLVLCVSELTLLPVVVPAIGAGGTRLVRKRPGVSGSSSAVIDAEALTSVGPCVSSNRSEHVALARR